MDIVLLAAGLGTRLKSRTSSSPKSLVPVLNKPLLDYNLEVFSNLTWVNKLIVVTGFMREKIVDHIHNSNVKIEWVEAYNPNFMKGNIYSVEQGLKYTREEFFITNADHLFPKDLLDYVHKNATEISAVCDKDRDLQMDCMKVKSKNIDEVDRISKKLDEYDYGYIGLTFVTKNYSQLYKTTLNKTIQHENENAYAEIVIGDLQKYSNHNCKIVDASGYGWIEVDNEFDLESAENILKKYPNFLKHGKNN